MTAQNVFLFLAHLFLATHGKHLLRDEDIADYVIVGAGTAGCALAARLCAQDVSKTVVLLERAQPREASLEIYVRAPRLIVGAVLNASLTETFLSARQHGLLDAPRLPLWAGNTLGGSSAINGMQWLLPLAETLDSWGIAGLNVSTARRFYKRALDVIGFAVPPPRFRHIHLGKLLDAARAAGVGTDRGALDDAPADNMFPNRIAVTTDTGRRVDSCSGYLRTAAQHCPRNLHVRHGVTVTGIQLERGRATGVEASVAVPSGKTTVAFFRARREVVLTAGPFHSPRLLQLSGIGPRDWLERAGVRVEVELPVGKHAQARTITGLQLEFTAARDPSKNVSLVYSATERQKFLRREASVLGKAYGLVNGRAGWDGYFSGSGIDIPPNDDRKFLNPTCVANPTSMATVRLASRDPLAPPVVDLGLLNRTEDVTRVQACLRKWLRIVERLPSQLGARLLDPADKNVSEAWIRRSAGWSGHLVGGCAVGSVLTPRFSVRNVQGLRVVDASSIPRMPVSAGPLASVYMIAEYAAELIANDNRT